MIRRGGGQHRRAISYGECERLLQNCQTGTAWTELCCLSLLLLELGVQSGVDREASAKHRHCGLDQSGIAARL